MKLEKLLTIINKSTSKEKLIEAFQLALVIILETEKGNQESFNEINSKYEEIVNRINTDTSIQELRDKLNEEITNLQNSISNIQLLKGDKGDKGDSIKGDKGDNYILTPEDKREIASSIEVPIVEKIIEKTEIIKEQPIVKEVAIHEDRKEIIDKINKGGVEKIDSKQIKGFDDLDRRISAKNFPVMGGGTPVSVSFNGLLKDKEVKNINFTGDGVASVTQTNGTVDVSINGGDETDPVWTADKPNYALSTAVADTYLSKVDASTTYLSQASASTTYLPIIANADVDLGAYDLSATDLTATGQLYLANTGLGTTNGVIYKGGVRFIHDYKPAGGVVPPVGYNLFIGAESGNFTFGAATDYAYDASYNTGIGAETLKAISGDASYNTVIGGQSGRALTTAVFNTIIGAAAGIKLTTSQGNTIIGSSALLQVTSGSNYNCGIGVSALSDLNGGDYNVAIGGLNTGGNLTTGSYNTIIGSQAGFTGTAMANSVMIGYKAGYYETASNKLFIDYSDTGRGSEAAARTDSLIYGVFNSTPANQILSLGGGGKVGINCIAPDKALEINSADGNNLRLTYNDNDGSATAYVDLLTTSSGDLTITPSGGDISIGTANLGTTGALKGVHKAADGTGAVADGTYTVGIGGTTNGTITIKDGIITAIQQAVA